MRIHHITAFVSGLLFTVPSFCQSKMQNDSFYQDIPTKEFADSLFVAVRTLNEHTDTMRGFSGCVTIFSFIASIITIIGLFMVGYELFKRHTSKRCQKSIILDIIRHLFTNNAISEVIRMKLQTNGNKPLKDGIMQRFCVLSTDIELSQFSYSAKNYEQLHSLKIKLRNYNVAALSAERMMTDARCPLKMKMEELDDILYRSMRLTEGFLVFAKARRLRIDKKVVEKYITDYYNEIDRIPKWKELGKIDINAKIPERKSGSARAFYDDVFGLKGIMNCVVRERISYVKFNPSKSTEI